MALELRIAGPGFETSRVLKPGDPEIVLGRDADCGVCLPDPQRNISRRHLLVWNASDELHFRVLSVVNGVEMPFGEAPPGAKGVLACGQTLRLAVYRLTVEAVAGAGNDADPWAVFDLEPSGGPASEGPQGTATEDDPFGEWGFETTFGPAGAGGGPLDASKLGKAADLAPFFHGLGLDPARVGPLSQGEVEAIGRLVRAAVLGLLETHRAAAGVKQELRAEDRTMVAAKDNNPLKSDLPEETSLQYLFGGRASSVGFLNPERALHELLGELLAHDRAVTVAARAAVEGVVREFSPEALKQRLLGGGSKLFEGARVWDAYTKYYAAQGTDFPAWAQRLLEKYFAQAYLRETVRLKRETGRDKR